MSSQVLARKWRPQDFQHVVGQQYILTALENSLNNQRLHHAYLFSGTRGVGKTSIARIFAKGLNCEQGISATPCNVCANCIAMNEGRFIDLLEIDAASRTKVEDTRELLDNVQYKPAIGRFKVYLIDEVHMLSKHSFNALLKTLEEPPAYVKFLLATTEPQKLPVTILSRCIQFQLRTLDTDDIAKHLTYILQQENIKYEPMAIFKLAKVAKGSIRDALSLTDQAIAVTNANISNDAVNKMLGLLDDEVYLKVMFALAKADGQTLMQLVQQIAEYGANWQQFIQDLLSIIHQIAVCQLLSPNNNPFANELNYAQITELAKQITAEDLQLYYQIILSASKEFVAIVEPRVVVEMALLKAVAFQLKTNQFIANDGQLKLATIDDSSNNLTNTNQVNTVTRQTQQNVQSVDDVNIVHQQHEKSVSNKAKNDITHDPLIKARLAIQENKQQILQSQAQPLEKKKLVKKTSKTVEKQVVPAKDYQWQWSDPRLAESNKNTKLAEIKLEMQNKKMGKLMHKINQLARQQDRLTDLMLQLDISKFAEQLLLHTIILAENEQTITLGLVDAVKYLNKKDIMTNIQTALDKHLQPTKKIQLEIIQEKTEEQLTPFELREKIFTRLTDEAKQALLQDKFLLKLQQEFDAQLDLDSVVPSV